MKLMLLALIALSIAPAQANELQGRVEQDEAPPPKGQAPAAGKQEKAQSSTSITKQATLNRQATLNAQAAANAQAALNAQAAANAPAALKAQVAMTGPGALGIIWDWQTGYVNFIDPISDVHCVYGDRILAVNGVPANKACLSGICLGPAGSFAQVTYLHNGVVTRQNARRLPVASLQPIWHLMNGEPVADRQKAMDSLNLYYLGLPLPPKPRPWIFPPQK
jgi:hypothetical protein